MTKRFILPGAAVAAVVFSAGVSALEIDDRWTGWIGCWRAEGAPAGELLCVVPDDEGVRMVTVSDGKVVGESRLIADAQKRPVTEGGCEGTESARWSDDGHRVFMRSETTCGSNLSRSVSGILAMISPTEWVNVQSVTVGDNPDHALARTVRYTAAELDGVPAEIAALASTGAVTGETHRWAATTPIDVQDIKEALEAVHYRAVEAFVIARGQPFDLDAKTLVALDDQGVHESVIDAMVAVSHPEHFAVVVEKEVPAYAAGDYAENNISRTYGARLCSSWGGAYNPWLDPFSPGDPCYGYSYLGMSRYGYNFGRYGYGWGYGYTPVIIIRNPNTQNPTEPVQRGSVSRSGYRSGSSTRGSARPRDPNPSSSVGATGSTSSSRATTSSTRSSSGGGSSSGGKVKPRGSGD